MNQQMGMEADREIDRFLQKVKRRDMCQRAIFLLGIYALIGSVLCFLTQCIAIWYPFYYCVPVGATMFGLSIGIGIVHLLLRRTTTKRAAVLADNMGMQERVSTSVENKGSTDAIRILQRVDTRDHIRAISLQQEMPYRFPWKRYACLGTFLLMGVICLFVPSEAKNTAKQKHEFVKKAEKEQTKIEKAKKALDQEAAEGKLSKASQKKLEEAIQTAQNDIKKAKNADEVAEAKERLKTKLLRDIPENISKETSDSLQPFVDGKNLQALSDYRQQLTQLASKQKAVAQASEELKELGEQLSADKMNELMQQLNEKANKGALTQSDIADALDSLDDAGASYTRSALQQNSEQNGTSQNSNQDNAGQNSNQNSTGQNSDQNSTGQNSDQNSTGQNSNQSSSGQNSNQSSSGQNSSQNGSGSSSGKGSGQNSSGSGGGQNQNGAQGGNGWNTGSKNGLKRDGSSERSEQVWVPQDNGKDGNLTGSKKGESSRTKTDQVPAKRGTKQEIGAVSGQYKQKAYSKLKKQKIPQSKEDMIKKYFSELE